MNKRKQQGSGVWLAVVAGLGLACTTQTLPPRPSPQESMERFLRTAPVTAINKDLSLGRMNAWLVTLNDGADIRQALFKSVRRQRPALMPDSYTYELAAYELDKILGLRLVPATVERRVENRTGSLQVFLQGVESEKSRLRKNLQPPDSQAYQDTLDEILIFENLAYAPRLDLGDILIQTDAWRVWRVDFSEAFKPEAELLPQSTIQRCSRRLYAGLRDWDEAVVREKLAAYLNPREMEALLKRRQLIMSEVERLIREKGEAAVIYRP